MGELFAYYPNGTDLIAFRDGEVISTIPDAGLTLGPVVYSAADMAAWSTSQAKYAALLASPSGDLSRVILDLGTSINSVAERQALLENSEYAKGMFVLGMARENSGLDGSAYFGKAHEVLDSCKDVATYAVESGQDNLVAGWFGVNLCQVAAGLSYSDPGFENFLRNVLYPMANWTTGANWFASFCDLRASIASYLKDLTLWNDMKAFTQFHLPQIFYHGDYDPAGGTQITPCRNGDTWPAKATGTINTTRTIVHWGNNPNSYPMVNSSFLANYEFGNPSGGPAFLNGYCAETTRDLSHINFSLAAMSHVLRTMSAVNDEIPQEWYDRLRAAADVHATRCQTYIDTNIIPAPVCRDGDGGDAWKNAWETIERTFLTDTPASVIGILTEPVIQNRTVDGALHMTAEPVADRAA